MERLKEEFSKNENVVTEYVNEEDGKLKTIIWTKGITPPKMGGQNSDFEKEITNVGNVRFVEYKSPYIEGQGWYDVNKTENRVPDENLCFAAAASNTLHWWLAQNSEYIDQYLEQTPDAPKAEEIKNLKHSFKSQQSSDIYKIFVRQFANKREGYWPDILQDQFINGYYPKKNGGTNDSDEAREELISKGPDKNGGFFYRIFGTTLLTKRHNYYQGYEAISRDIKHYFQNGDIVLLTYNMKTKSHVVTLWGAEFDSDGKISAVYFSDSDDDKKYGMQRYKIVNVGGKAIATTRNDGQGSLVESLQIISTGKKIWEDKLNLSKTQLELIWGDTNFIYNGEPQKPTLTAANIKDGDDITLSAEGDKIDAGTYTATAVLGGAAADHYELPPEYTKQFTIQKAPTKVALSADVQNENHSNQVHFEVNIAGVNDEVLEGSIIFKDGDTVIAKDVPVSDGKASYVWKSPEVGRHYIVAEFLPASDGAGKNYRNTASQVVNVDVSKIEQSTLSIQPVTDKIYGDKPFALATQGGSGTGKVKFESSDPDILSIAENIATIHKAGTVTINAIKAGDKTYHSATATYKMDVKKAPAPEIAYPVAGNLTYGQKLSDSTLIGGSTQYGSFAWENEELIPAVSNNGYNVKFTPNAHTLENYESVESMTSKIQVPVTKANPTVVLTSEVENEAGSKKVLLSASVENVGYGDEPAGSIKFIDCTNGNDVEIGDTTSVVLENGVATYTWKGMPKNLYQIKAVYSGDRNYQKASSAQVSVDLRKKLQEHFAITPIASKTYGDKPFVLATQGGNGTGTVIFESSDSDILSISENVATIHKAGSVTITATKAGDEDYYSATATYKMNVKKAPAPKIVYPTASNLTYGQKLSDSMLTGGSTKYGSFAWENGELVPTVKNNAYNVKFTPNAHTLENYETIESMTSKIQVPVTKANPTVVLTSEVENEAGSKKVLLSASVENVGYGDEPAGTVKFVDCSNGVDVALGDAVAVENGVATYSWTDMLQKRYQIKAIYNGDENYTQTSSAEVCIDGTKKTQSYFEIVPIHPITYGDEPFILFTKGGDGSGTVQFESSDSDILSIAENIATIHKAGAVTVTATKSGDADYNETKASITVEIHKKLLTITAEDKLNIVAGSQMPQFTYKVQGLEVGDVFTIEPIMTTQAENTSGVGEHEIVISGGDLTNRESYQIVYVNGKMTIVDNREDTTIIEDIPKEEGKKETEALNYIEESNISSAEVNEKSTSAKTKLNVMKSQGTPSDPVNTKDLSYVEDKGLQNNQKVLATVLVCAALVGVGAVSIRIFRKRRSRK